MTSNTKSTNKPKSITLQEFEELANTYVESHNDAYGSDAMFFLDEFKSIAFKEELEKDQRRKEYKKLKEEYFKLKDEFEPKSAEDSASNYKKQDEVDGCEGCVFLKDNGGCSQQKGLPYTCGIEKHIWIKAE